MRILSMHRQSAKALPLVLLLLGLQACSMETVQIPELSGPSELALSLQMRANPDWVVADNESVSEISATLRGPNGQPLGGRGILFTLTDASGNPAAIGELSSTTGQVIASGQSATAVTNGQGLAQVRLSAPARTDILSATIVIVAGRPMGDDASAAIYRTVRIEVVPAEPRLFPPNPTNTPPVCSFVIQPVKTQYKVGEQILFQAAAADPDGRIVRYEWDFGDNSPIETNPDVNHAYGKAGTYQPFLLVVDNNGGSTSCGIPSGSGITAINVVN